MHSGTEAKAPSSDIALAEGEMQSSSVFVLRPDSHAWSPQMIQSPTGPSLITSSLSYAFPDNGFSLKC